MHFIQAQHLAEKIKISTYFKISDLWLIVGVSQIITAVSFWLTRGQDEPDGQFEARVTHSAHYPVSSRTSNHIHVLRDPPHVDASAVFTPILTHWHSQIFKSTENSARNFVFHNKQRKYCCSANTQPLNIARVVYVTQECFYYLYGKIHWREYKMLANTFSEIIFQWILKP